MGETIEQAIGREIRRLREAAGVGQSVLAAAARQYGLPWTRAMIAAVELGRKRLSLGELALMPLVLVEANITGGIVLSLGDLIPTDPTDQRSVDAGPGLQLPLRIARGLLLGDPAAAAEVPTLSEAAAIAGAAHRLIATITAATRAIEAAGDAEQKAALALRVSPDEVVEAAHRLWGCSLTARRDRLVAMRTDPMLTRDPEEARSPEWPRRLQAIRGHVTRDLLKELTKGRKKPTKRRTFAPTKTSPKRRLT